MKALVTGGAGFLGSRCLEALLKRGIHLTVLDDFSTGTEANLETARARAARDKLELHVVKGSISDHNIWQKIDRHDVLFHFASPRFPAQGVKGLVTDFDENVLPVKWMVEWLRKHQVRMCMLAQPALEIYGQVQTLPVDERSSLAPLSSSGATRSFVENYLAALTRGLKESGEISGRPDEGDYFTWASVRLGHVYGPGQSEDSAHPRSIPSMIRTLLSGKAPTIFGDGTRSRDYVFVDDCVDAIMFIFDKMQSQQLDDCFNVGSGTEMRDIDVFDSVLEGLEARAKGPAAPPALKAFKAPNEPHFNRDAKGEPVRLCLNINKIEAFLDWRPRVEFKDGLEQTIAAFKF